MNLKRPFHSTIPYILRSDETSLLRFKRFANESPNRPWLVLKLGPKYIDVFCGGSRILSFTLSKMLR